MSEVERKTSEQKFQWISSAMGKPLWKFFRARNLQKWREMQEKQECWRRKNGL